MDGVWVVNRSISWFPPRDEGEGGGGGDDLSVTCHTLLCPQFSPLGPRRRGKFYTVQRARPLASAVRTFRHVLSNYKQEQK
jgi:hypothetical protein